MESRESFVKRRLSEYGMSEIEWLLDDLAREGEGEKLRSLYCDLECIFADERFMREYDKIVRGLSGGGLPDGDGDEVPAGGPKVSYAPPGLISWSRLAGREPVGESEIEEVIRAVRTGGCRGESADACCESEGRRVEGDSFLVTDLEEMPPGIREYIYQRGIRRLSEGKVAVVIMSGGDGSRLGYNGPKGMYPIGRISGDSFFKIFCQRIQSLMRLVHGRDGGSGASGGVPLYIMASERNHDAISRYFEENRGFGLEDVTIFTQDSVPSINIQDNGSFFIKEDLSILKSPSGNGGIFSSMRKHGIIQDMLKKGIEYVFIQCIDNPLCKVCDPFFIGYSDLLDLQVSTKTIRKRSVDESIGSIAQKLTGGRCTSPASPCIVEYTELSRLGNNKDRFLFGSIGIHLFRLSFIQEISNKMPQLPFHKAYKKVPHLKYPRERATPHSRPKLCQPTEANGIKLETFIFDSFTLTSTPIHCINVSRDEFSPVKSASGRDSPEACQNAISNLNKRRLAAALNPPNNEDNPEKPLLPPSKYVEISSLVSFDGEGLQPLSKLITETNHELVYINDDAQLILLN
ncbi:UDP-N-acetylglucosamine pyrophosphorylase [Cryptosporidium canis]|uniref:UDP-N-acetylglucosamine diphosphorylase n=1 Tax=Cryptosporidium canis TaxID=195482 RepID=A0A9D5DIN6_9CRYT|nr:UDP-N-acetylglucosamine pyrophosphorylase [Cryptosporidium canis]